MTRHIEEAAKPTAAAFANHMGSGRSDHQRSDGEKYSDTESPVIAGSSIQECFIGWPHSKLGPLKNYPREDHYNSHLPSYVQGVDHMEGQQQTLNTTPCSNVSRRAFHAAVYEPPSHLEPPAGSDRHLGSTAGAFYMSTVAYQSPYTLTTTA